MKTLTKAWTVWPAVEVVNISRDFRGTVGSYQEGIEVWLLFEAAFHLLLSCHGLKLLEFLGLFIREVVRLIQGETILLCQTRC